MPAVPRGFSAACFTFAGKMASTPSSATSRGCTCRRNDSRLRQEVTLLSYDDTKLGSIFLDEKGRDRYSLNFAAAVLIVAGLPLSSGILCAAEPSLTLTTTDKTWVNGPSSGGDISTATPGKDVIINVDPSQTFQTMDGFGGCFNELGWTALQTLTPTRVESGTPGSLRSEGCELQLLPDADWSQRLRTKLVLFR